MKKKLVSVLMCMAMGATLLAGCGGDTAADSSSSDVSDTSWVSSDSQQGQKPDGEPPEKPDGDDSEPPAKPDGDNGEAPTGEKPDGEPPQGDGQGGPGGAPGGQSQGVDSYDAANDYTEDTTVEGETLESAGTDENAVWISDGATVSFRNIELKRTSEDSTGGDNSSFYGVGAGLLVTEGTAYIDNSTITTDAAGGAGVFAYGDGVAYVADTTIQTTKDTSGGIHVAGGGTLYAWDLNVETQGASSAAIRSDRGGGTASAPASNRRFQKIIIQRSKTR